MAKNDYKFIGKADDEIIVFPNLGLALKNEQLNEAVVKMLQKKLGDDFSKFVEKVSSVKAEK